ncbi:Vgb family protein [Ilumatobacter nonamiensis]|uniref:Vgb family protein n=1 Tax=Ilumatobacter nonamiensis TaxID=467093 RepID=UPI0011D20064|nr:lyase [Ilumatobacter nonamiensis]
MSLRRPIVIGAVALAFAGCTSSGESAGTSVPTDPTTATTAPDVTDTTVDEPPPSEAAPTSTSSETSLPAPDTTSPPTTSTPPQPVAFDDLETVEFPVPAGSRPHDVAPAADGGVWYTAQRAGALGHLDPVTGETRHIPLGNGSAPHGVIVDENGVAWVTDGGLDAIVSVDATGDVVTVFPLPDGTDNANLNTAAFAGDGRLWFTGQNGIYGVLDPASQVVEVHESPRGPGPYGITATPDGHIYYASLAGSYVGAIDSEGEATVIEPPTPEQGARRVWSDSSGAIWVSEWNSGQLSRFTPTDGGSDAGDWSTWQLPGPAPATYAVYVDHVDQVWVSDFGGNALHRFDPASESFETFPLPADSAGVRQILGRGDEIWGAQSADDSLVVIRPRT